MLEMTSKQNEYILNANARWNLKEGAVRSGKSYVDVNYIILARIVERRGKPGLNVIMGVSRETIERNVLQPMRETYTDAIVGHINGRNIVRIAGEDVYCIGTEKESQVAKIQGMSIKYCYGDEVAKWNEKVFEMLKSRLDKAYSCFDGSFNPEYPTHWLKRFIDTDGLNVYIQHYTIFDNPYLPDEYVHDLCKEYEGTVYYDRYILGKWALAEGIIYPMYLDAIETMPLVNGNNAIPSEYCLSIDYGTQNAFAAIKWAKFDGVWYAIDEYYWSGRDKGEQKTDKEYADDMYEFVLDILPHLRTNEGEKLTVIVDPSAASFIAEMRKRSWCKILKANNDVSNGIRDTASAMKSGLIKVDPKMKNWEQEAGGYAWDPKSGDDSPIKENDHLMDSMRYFVMTKRVYKPKRR